MYQENLKALKQLNPRLREALDSLDSQDYRTEPSRSQHLTLVYRNKADNRDYYIHSKFKPRDEAARILQKANLNADHIIVFGLGLGYLLELVLAGKSQDTRVLLIEPQLEIFGHSLKTLDWRQLFHREDFFYCLGADMNMVAASVRQFLDVPVFDTLEWVELPSEVRFLGAFFDEARKEIDNEIKTLLYDFKTRVAEDSVVPRNILKNINGILHTRPVKSLQKRFAGKPAIIVSAGPSLDKNILFLKKIANRAVIICVDTALKPLLKRGIQPHFTVTADPSYKNYLHLQGTENRIGYFLVSDTGISSRVYDDFKRHMFSVSLGKPILKMIEESIGEIGEVEAWGSVISLALSFAIYMDCDPVVFLGQDFAFSGMRNHCRGTSWEDTWLEYSRDLDLMQRREKQSITGIARTSEVPDIYNNTAITSDRLLLYKNFLVKILAAYQGRRFINASEGGILTEIETMPFHRVLEEFIYSQEALDFESLFDIPLIYNTYNKKKLVAFFKAKSSFFKKYRRKTNEIAGKLEGAEHLSFDSASQLVRDAQKVKDQLYENIQNGEIVEMWSQAPIFFFLKGFSKLGKKRFDESSQKEWIHLFREYFTKLMPHVTGIIESFDSGVKQLHNNR